MNISLVLHNIYDPLTTAFTINRQIRQDVCSKAKQLSKYSENYEPVLKAGQKTSLPANPPSFISASTRKTD